MILEALTKIFKIENSYIKHMILFCLTGIPTMLSLSLGDISKMPHISSATFWMSMLGFLLIFVAWIYLWGYLFDFIRNTLDKSNEQLMPDFSLNQFKSFFKALPLLLVWGFYIILLFAIAFIIKIKLTQNFPIYNYDINILAIIALIPVLIISVMFPYLAIKFVKKQSGVYDILLPFKYLTLAFMETLWLLIRALPLILLFTFIEFLSNTCLSSIMTYLFSALSSYISTITLFALYYCYADIYREKIEPND